MKKWRDSLRHPTRILRKSPEESKVKLGLELARPEDNYSRSSYFPEEDPIQMNSPIQTIQNTQSAEGQEEDVEGDEPPQKDSIVPKVAKDLLWLTRKCARFVSEVNYDSLHRLAKAWINNEISADLLLRRGIQKTSASR